MLSTPANALPIASPIPDATGATAAAVAGVVHLLSVYPYEPDYMKSPKLCQGNGEENVSLFKIETASEPLTLTGGFIPADKDLSARKVSPTAQ